MVATAPRGELGFLAADPVGEVLRGEREPAHRGQEAHRNGPDALVPFLRKLEAEEKIQRLEDGEAATEQDSADRGEKCGEPEPMVEQPEFGVAFLSAEKASEANRERQGGEEKGDEDPHLPLKAKQEGDCRDAGEPCRHPRSLRTVVRLDVEVDGNDPEKGCGKRTEHLVFGFARIVDPELEDGDEAGKKHGQRKTRKSRADVWKPAPPGPAPSCLCH